MELSLSESLFDPDYSVGYAPAGKASRSLSTKILM